MSRYEEWPAYVSVAERQQKAAKAISKAKKAGKTFFPVEKRSGRALGTTFWGKAWCANLEKYGDYENRLPRGRTYVRNGSVVDLQIKEGKISAKVMGSSLYNIEIEISPLNKEKWQQLSSDCAGEIDSLIALLQGKLSEEVMARMCQEDALFPKPAEIHFKCSCPDWAYLCKHVAAALYGVGFRLDEHPELLFTLRAVDANELIAKASEARVKTDGKTSKKRLAGDALSALFGLQMADKNEGTAEQKPAKKLITQQKKGVAPNVKKPLAAPKKEKVDQAAQKGGKKVSLIKPKETNKLSATKAKSLTKAQPAAKKAAKPTAKKAALKKT